MLTGVEMKFNYKILLVGIVLSFSMGSADATIFSTFNNSLTNVNVSITTFPGSSFAYFNLNRFSTISNATVNITGLRLNDSAGGIFQVNDTNLITFNESGGFLTISKDLDAIYNFDNNNNWILIGTSNPTARRSYQWNGTSWNLNMSLINGIKVTDCSNSVNLAFGYNVSGGGKWNDLSSCNTGRVWGYDWVSNAT